MNSKKIISDWGIAGAVLAFLLILTMVLYRQTVVYLVSIWNEISIGEYAHGYLVVAISLYLLVNNRKKLARLTPCPSYTILPLVLLSAFLLFAAVIVDVEALQAAALLAVVFSIVWTVSGHQAMKQLAFPIIFIGFAIPVWFPLSPLLQDMTADVVFGITRLLKIPALREGSMIIVPSGVFSIEEACSGLRYLLSALTLGSLYAYLNYVSLRARIIVVLIAACAALLANVLRVFIVIYLGYSTQMQHPWVHDHLMLGWYLFGGLVALLLFLDFRFYTHDATSSLNEDISDEIKTCQKKRYHYAVISGLCAVVLLTGPIVLSQLNNQQSSDAINVGIHSPLGASGWSDPVASTNDWMPQYHGSISVKNDYQIRGDDVSLFVAYYPSQTQGSEVINDLNKISGTKNWYTKYTRALVRSVSGQKVLEQLIENGQNKKQLVWYWYNIGGQVTVNKYEAKLMQLTSLLTGNQQASMVAVSIAVRQDIDQSREALRTIIADMGMPRNNLLVTEIK